MPGLMVKDQTAGFHTIAVEANWLLQSEGYGLGAWLYPVVPWKKWGGTETVAVAVGLLELGTAIPDTYLSLSMLPN